MALALGVLFFFFMRHTLSSGRSFGLFRDNESLLGPLLSVLSRGISGGDWPLRTDTFLGGMPLYDMPQLSVLYPFYFSWFPLFKTPFDTMHSLHGIVLLHVLITEINVCIFLRVVRLSRCAAVLGAVLFAFSANSFTYASWVNILAPYSWLPLYLAGLVGILNYGRERRYVLMALVGLVMLVWASPAQPLIHAIFLTFIFVIVNFSNDLGAIENRQSKYFQRLLPVLIISVLSILIAAPIIGPLLANANGMIRWIGPFPPVIGNARIPFEAFTTDQLTLRQLGGSLFKLESHAVGQEYVGLIPLFLALLAVVLRRRAWLVQALTIVGLYSILAAAGTNSGLAYLNYHLPILNKIREPSRFLVLFQFSIAVLAAVGLDEVRAAIVNDEGRRRKIFFMLVASLAVAALVAFLLRHDIVSRLRPWVSMAALAILWIVVVVSSRHRSKYSVVAAVSCWIIVICGFQAVEVRWIPSLVSDSDYLQKHGVELDRALARVQKMDSSRSYRVIFDGQIDKQAAAMLASYRNIRTLNAYINPAPLRLFEQMYYHLPSADNYYFSLGTKYLICDECNKAAVRGFHKVGSEGDLNIYEADSVSPHSYQRTTADGIFYNLNDFRSAENNSDFTSGILFLQNGDAQLLALGVRDKIQCQPLEQRRTPNYERFGTECSEASVIVLNEFNDRGWTAYVDGVRTRILVVNGNQMGVYVPAGTHYVEYRYAPTVFYFSLLLAGLGIISSGVYIWNNGRRNR